MMQRKLRILLGEKAPGEAAAALGEVFSGTEDNLHLTVVSTLATLLASLSVADPEVILLDLALSPGEPMDAVRVVHRSAPGVPLIVFADPGEKQWAAQSLAEGALDYLLKGFMDTRTVERVLRCALERNTYEGLTDLLRDSVTGLYTRDGFLILGGRALEEAHRTGGELVLLCAYIENLQMLRDGFGPGAGDRAVLDVAALLAESCRRTDIVARLGDSQFAMLAIDAASPSAPVLRQRVEQHVAVHNHDRSEWGPLEMRLSLGTWSGQDPRSFAQFLDEIESQLRRASADAVGVAASEKPATTVTIGSGSVGAGK